MGPCRNLSSRISSLSLLLLIWLASIVQSCRIIAYAGDEQVDARKLLLDTENSLPELAYGRSFLPALKASKHWNPEQCSLRNTNENRDGWGVAWYDDHSGMGYPIRFRTPESLVDENNATVPLFISLLDGNVEVSRSGAATESGGAFTHVQGLLFGHKGHSIDDSVQGEVVSSCGPEDTQVTNSPIQSQVLFGHVRKATSAVTPENAHPFVFGNLLWMHNGALPDFDAYREVLLRKLRPSVRGLLSGSVDSEHAGLLFCNHLEGFPSQRDRPYTMSELRGAMRTVVSELRAMSAEAALDHCIAPPEPSLDYADSAGSRVPWAPSSMNFAVSDGRGLVVTRFRSSKNEDPPSLYYKLGVPDYYRASSQGSATTEATMKKNANGLIIASEPLEETLPALSSWRLLGKDKMISFSPDEGVRIECMSERCTPDLPADHGLLSGEVE